MPHATSANPDNSSTIALDTRIPESITTFCSFETIEVQRTAFHQALFSIILQHTIKIKKPYDEKSCEIPQYRSISKNCS